MLVELCSGPDQGFRKATAGMRGRLHEEMRAGFKSNSLMQFMSGCSMSQASGFKRTKV